MQRPVVVTEVFIVTFHDEPAGVGADPAGGGAQPIELTTRASVSSVVDAVHADGAEHERPWASAEPRREGLGSAMAGSGWTWAEPGTVGPTPLRQARAVVPAGPTGGAPPAHTMPMHMAPTRPGAAVSGPLPPVPLHAYRDGREVPSAPGVLPFPPARRTEAGPPATLAVPTPLPVRREVRIAPSILRAMAAAATASGRGESEIWAEAARAWLARRGETAGEPWTSVPTGAAGSSAHERLLAARRRCWSAIDILLSDLRTSRHVRDAAEVDGAACTRVGTSRRVRILAPGGDEPPPAA